MGEHLSWHVAYLNGVLRSISNVAGYLSGTQRCDFRLLGNAEVISLLGESPYFADADLSKWGYGSKVSVLHLTTAGLIEATLQSSLIMCTCIVYVPTFQLSFLPSSPSALNFQKGGGNAVHLVPVSTEHSIKP